MKAESCVESGAEVEIMESWNSTSSTDSRKDAINQSTKSLFSTGFPLARTSSAFSSWAAAETAADLYPTLIFERSEVG